MMQLGKVAKAATQAWAAAGLVLALLMTATYARAEGMAPATANFTRLWHQGRVIGELDPIVAFYHGALGLGSGGDLEKARAFRSSAPVNIFVGNPPETEFHALQMPIPGASPADRPADVVTLEAFGWRDFGLRRPLPALSDTGVSNLVFVVRDLERALAAVRSTGATVVTPGGRPIALAGPSWAPGAARAIMVRDPDGYPVELLEVSPTPSSLAGPDSNVLGSATVLVVADLDASLKFYRDFLGQGVQATPASPWRDAGGLARLRDLGKAAYRSASLALPGSTVTLQLIQFRGLAQKPYRPAYRNIGHAHLAFYTPDIGKVFEVIQRLGAQPLSGTGSWTTFSPTLKGFYTRDPDGFFLEVIERD